MSKHTPTPWNIEELSPGLLAIKGANATYTITRIEAFDVAFKGLPEDKANAEFIVLAANCHTALVSNLRLEHEDAIGDEHFEKVSLREIGCSVCSLLAKAEARP